MPKTIQLSVFKDYPAAALMLHLARGQLYRAYHLHGLQPPDALRRRSGGNQPNRTVPHADVEQAHVSVDEALATWEAEMPTDLVSPILAILQRTCVALSCQPGSTDARSAALEAVDILKRISANED